MALAENLQQLCAEYSPAAILDAVRAHHGMQDKTDEEIFVLRYGDYFHPTPEYRAKARAAYRRFLECGVFEDLPVAHDLLGPQ